MEPARLLRRTVGRVTRRRLIGTVATASALATIGVTPARTVVAAENDDQLAPREARDLQTTFNVTDQTDVAANHRPGFFDDLGQTGATNPAFGTPRPDGRRDQQAPRRHMPSICQGGTDA